jgi:hypothetical protein
LCRLLDELEDLWTLSLSPEDLERGCRIDQARPREQLARIQRLETALGAFDRLLLERRNHSEAVRPSTLAGRLDLIQTFEHEVGLS